MRAHSRPCFVSREGSVLRILCTLAVLIFPVSALADRGHADTCAVELSGLALKTYQASVGLAERGQTLRQAIGGYLRPLVQAGQVKESDGRKAGFAAAMCVRLVHRKADREARAGFRKDEERHSQALQRQMPWVKNAKFKPRDDDDDDDDDD